MKNKCHSPFNQETEFHHVKTFFFKGIGTIYEIKTA